MSELFIKLLLFCELSVVVQLMLGPDTSERVACSCIFLLTPGEREFATFPEIFSNLPIKLINLFCCWIIFSLLYWVL